MLTGVDPPLDGAVVLLKHVIQMRHWPMPAILGQIAFGFELRNGGRIRGVASAFIAPAGTLISRPSDRRMLSASCPWRSRRGRAIPRREPGPAER
jgi:hypothetical protein